MKDSRSSLKLAQRITFLIISISLIIWAVWPELEPQVGGWLIGLIGSLLMTWHIEWKTTQITKAVAATGRKPRVSLGFLTRACLGLLAFVIAHDVLNYNFYMTIVGLFVVQLITIALICKATFSFERGEKE